MPLDLRAITSFAFLALHCLVASTLALTPAPLRAQEPANLTPAQRELLEQRQRLWTEASRLADEQQWDAAIAAGRALLEFQQQKLGAETPDACTIVENIASWQERKLDFQASAATLRELVPLVEKVFGKDHWRTVNIRILIRADERLAKLSPDDQRRIPEAAALDQQALQQLEAGNPAAALERAQQALEIRLKLLGRDDASIPPSLANVGRYYLALGDYEKGRPLIEESVTLHQRVFGEKHPQTLAALNNLAALYADTRDFRRAKPLLEKVVADLRDVLGPDHSDTVEVLFNLGSLYVMTKDFVDAQRILPAVLTVQQNLYGPQHVKVARTIDCLGTLYTRTGDYQQAEQCLAQSLQMYRKLLGDGHPATADALYGLGVLYDQMGRSAEAEKHLQQSLTIRTSTLGNQHPDTAAALGDLAKVFEERGDLGQAERLFRSQLKIRTQVYGSEHLKTGQTMGNLGSLYIGMRDFSKARFYLQQAVDIYSRQLGPSHADTAVAMQLLGNACKGMGQLDEAHKLLTDALRISQEALQPDDPQIAGILTNLANVDELQFKYDEAAPRYEQALAILDRLGPDDPRPALALSYLARVAFAKGDFHQARDISIRAITRIQVTLSPHHTHLVDVLVVAALSNLGLNDVPQAKALLDRALDVVHHQVDADSALLAERQQLAAAASLRFVLDMYLSLPDEQVSPDDMYAQLLLWKGAIQARQIRDRRQRSGEAAQLADELQNVCSHLTALSLKVPEAEGRDAWRKQIDVLNQRRESLEADLAYLSRDFAAQKKASAVTPQQLCDLLPAGTALVDVVENSQFAVVSVEGRLLPSYQKRYVAFVVRPDLPIQRVDLGPSRPINEAVDAWRKSRGFPPDGAAVHPAAVTLGQLVWQPLQSHLDDCHTVLFSPDSHLARLPLGVLPGSEPGSYLIEEIAVAIVPVPQRLPELLTEQLDSSGDPHAPSMLLVGAVDYEAPPGRSGNNEGQLSLKDAFQGSDTFAFGPLKSTGTEVHELADRFQERFPDGKVTLLEKADASEDAFRRQAPQHTLLLLATHGFFAPPGIGSALAVQDRLHGAAEQSGFHCGTLSGLALAGANTRALPDGDDGILTASEVATLDLRNIDLAVLSGCETGLGQLAGGEGAVGLQRAFQVAGARTTIASLWTVPDQKTSQIMRRFYANLWDKRMSKLEALREAQVWMLRTGGKEIAADGPDGADSAAPPGKRQPPYFWAAFQLSGDWR